MTKISIILPVYNAGKSLTKTILSVLKQTYKDFELIIIDDGSNDNSRQIEIKFNESDSRIHLLFNEKNYGVSYSRNKGIDVSEGQYIAFIDADDEWFPDKLEKQINYIEKNKVEWVFSNYKYVSKNNMYIVKRKSGKYSYQDILTNGNPIGLLTCLLSKKIIGKTRFTKKHHEDYIFWLNIAKKGYEAYNTGDIVAIYSAMYKGISSNKIKSFFWTFKIYLHECDSLKAAIKLQMNYVRNYFSRKQYGDKK